MAIPTATILPTNSDPREFTHQWKATYCPHDRFESKVLCPYWFPRRKHIPRAAEILPIIPPVGEMDERGIETSLEPIRSIRVDAII